MTSESGFQAWACYECGAKGPGGAAQLGAHRDAHPWLRFGLARALFNLGSALQTASQWLRWER